MNNLRLTLVAVILTVTGTLFAAEFSAEKIHHYAAYVRVTPEVKDYIRELPPEAINQIADQLDFKKDGRGKNMLFFSFTCSKASQLQLKGIEFDEDYIFGKLTSFVRSAIKKGHVRKGSGAMNSLSNFDHPEVIKLAKELEESDDELTRSNAKLLLKKHEQRKSAEEQRIKRGVRPVESDNKNRTNKNQSKNHVESNSDKAKKSQSSSKWLYIVLVIIFTSGVFWYLKRK